MKTKPKNIILLISLLFLTFSVSFAQSSENDWNAVKLIQQRTDLFVKPKFGKQVFGEFVSANDEEIKLLVKDANIIIQKNEIETIHFAVPKSNKRGKTIGVLVGAFAGAALGGFLDRNADYESDYNYSRSVLLTAAGGVGGYFVGKSLSKGKKKGVIVYRSQ
ncbi:MAG TPA: hypothetical protein PKY59_13625 [Pyrinomonadaceae bacterium]|nr:hypothetical protein [Pyrinomonadaceae bacterium]